MPPSEMSFKEKYLKLRERFDAVSGVHRQYTNELDAAQDKVRRLRDENNHLLDLLSDLMKKDGTEPVSDSETSSDEGDEGDMGDANRTDEEALWRSRHSSAKNKRQRSSQRTPLPDQSAPINGH